MEYETKGARKEVFVSNHGLSPVFQTDNAAGKTQCHQVKVAPASGQRLYVTRKQRKWGGGVYVGIKSEGKTIHREKQSGMNKEIIDRKENKMKRKEKKVIEARAKDGKNR